MTRALALATLDTFIDGVHELDAMTLLRSLPSASIDLIATDPPYFKVKMECEWDRQWPDVAAYLDWLAGLCEEWRRVLKPNGSLYLFCETRKQAAVEQVVGRYFNMLTNIRWRKPPFSTKAEMFDKDMLHAFFPASETILFAEQSGADSDYDGALVDENLTYRQACETVKRSLFGAYLEEEFSRAKATRREIAALFPSKTGGLTGCVSNWVLGYNIPTPVQYQQMRDYLNAHHRNGSADYLRRDYEDLRRPFNVSQSMPYTDVWDFPTVHAYDGKHPAEKPLALMRHIIAASTTPGAVVLDTFGGSGSTGDAARQLGRHYILCDTGVHWVNYARRRLSLPWQAPLFEVATSGERRADPALVTSEQLALFAADAQEVAREGEM